MNLLEGFPFYLQRVNVSGALTTFLSICYCSLGDSQSGRTAVRNAIRLGFFSYILQARNVKEIMLSTFACQIPYDNR